MDSGRMINVYDWYEAFALAIENQRTRVLALEKLRAVEKAKVKKAKGKGKAKAVEEVEAEKEEEKEDDEEMWKMHVQARFIRALHELDFMGFVKHTGRKADHVVRTVYDGAD